MLAVIIGYFIGVAGYLTALFSSGFESLPFKAAIKSAGMLLVLVFLVNSFFVHYVLAFAFGTAVSLSILKNPL